LERVDLTGFPGFPVSRFPLFSPPLFAGFQLCFLASMRMVCAMPFWSIKRILVSVVILLVLGVGIFQAVHPEVSKRWLANRYANKAEILAKNGAHQAAHVAALKALEYDPENLRTLEALLSEIPESSPNELLFVRARIGDLKPNDQENLGQLALLAISQGQWMVASKVIDQLEKVQSNPIVTLELRARLAAGQNDFADAEQQAQLLLQRDPKNPAGRLIRLIARIDRGNASSRAEAEADLQDLLTLEPFKLEALRGLRQLAILNTEFARAKGYSESIIAAAEARFDDWLTHGEILFEDHPEQVPEILKLITPHAQADPQALAAIALWLRKIGCVDLVQPWVDQTEALRKNPVTAQMIQADTLMFRKAWPELGAFLIPLKWGGLEFYRLALLARSFRERNESFAIYWNAATTEALKEENSSMKLAEIIATWNGWEPQRDEFLWSIAQKFPSEMRRVLSTLNQFYQGQKNTTGLLRVSEELIRVYPSNEMVKNNLAFFSLLLNTQTDRSLRLMEELYAAHPKAPEIASTYSLAMLRKRDFKKALEVLEQLPAEARNNNAIAPYYAAALAANGRGPEALQVKQSINQADLLPEEKQLLEF
jgi:tetratricopeptide (TPR) repeat protein